MLNPFVNEVTPCSDFLKGRRPPPLRWWNLSVYSLNLRLRSNGARLPPGGTGERQYAAEFLYLTI